GAPAHRPPGSRRDLDRRGSRSRDRGYRDPGLAHRPSGLLDAPHERCAGGDHAVARHGRRAVPRRVGARGCDGPAAGPAHLRRAPTREIRRAAVEAGMITLRLDGWAKACEGVTTVEEILRVTQEDA